MEAISNNFLIKNTKAKSCNMPNEIDHAQLCLWLKNVAEERDKKAFTQLFNFFAPKILRITRSKFANESQASEVVQETMAKVWKKAHMFKAEKGAATTWVYTIMRNITFDLLRKVRSNREDCISDDIWPLAEFNESEEYEFDDHLQNKQLLRVIDTLPVPQQEVVKGFYLMEMSQEQLAQHLNLPLGTIKSRLRLALGKLKVQLGEQHD